MPRFSDDVIDRALRVRGGDTTLSDLPAAEQAQVRAALRSGEMQMVQRARTLRDTARSKSRFQSARTGLHFRTT